MTPRSHWLVPALLLEGALAASKEAVPPLLELFPAARSFCRSSEQTLKACLQDLAVGGLPMLGSTMDLLQACGDENPLLLILEHPEWLPSGKTRERLLRPAAATEAALRMLTSAFGVVRQLAEGFWLLAVENAMGCLLDRQCGLTAEEEAGLQEFHAAFLSAAAGVLGGLAAASSEGTHRLFPGLGEPALIFARHAFDSSNMEFSRSVLGGLPALAGLDTTGVLHDFSLRAARSNCEMMAQLLAHAVLSGSLGPQPQQLWRGPGDFPRFEYRQGACCKRYHVLGGLLESLRESRGASKLRVLEVGVNNAVTSEYLLRRFPDIDFDGVDPFIQSEDIFTEAKRRLAPFQSRARLWRLRSDEAAQGLGSYDLIFIDGDHSREAVATDLQTWKGRVLPGGILAGHDLFNLAYEGVLEALLEHLVQTGERDPTVHFGADFVWWFEL